MAKQLINDPATVVDEMLEGLVASNPHICCLKQYRLILDSRYESIKESRVTLISGGGSGHEPAHAGYVGDGMLTAAVCGDVFSSPSMLQVLTALRLVTGPYGCLVIIKNYTGDRLNFGLAVEEARSEGLKVEVVFVGEDCAVDAKGVTGRRGLAGTALVHKIAGAAAKNGLSLVEVRDIAAQIARNMGTVGVALKSCTLPGKLSSERIGNDVYEVGLGIHGEPGVRQCKMTNANEIADEILEPIFHGSTPIKVQEGDSVVVLVNNLGGTPLMELFVVARRAVKYLEEKKMVKVSRVFVGSYMTALDMVGCSITVLNANAVPNCVELLECDVGCTGWPKCVPVPSNAATRFVETSKIPVPRSPEMELATPSSKHSMTLVQFNKYKSAIQNATKAIIAAEPDLTKWDTLVGDGDCGSTLESGASAVLQMIDERQRPFESDSDMLYSISESLRDSIGGTSGILYTIFFKAAGTSLKQPGSDVQRWLNAFAAGIWAIERTGGATEGCRTMLDALHPARRAAEDLISASSDVGPNQVLRTLVQAAEDGATATQEMSSLNAAGRTAYVSKETAEGVPDPGAKAVSIWLRALYDTFYNDF